MHEKTYPLVNKAIREKKLRGNDLSCEYNPCHKGLEDCTFCYCPFYPCINVNTGGREIVNSRTGVHIWDCSGCVFPHKTVNAQEILDQFISLEKELGDITHVELLQISSAVKKLNPKNNI